MPKMLELKDELFGCDVALEDCIMKKGCLATAGSTGLFGRSTGLLANFVAPFDATVVERLRDAGIAIADSRLQTSDFGVFVSGLPPEAHKVVDRSTGPIPDAVHCCLCNDLFGQYRRQAAENGLCYIHPTYGTVSRYGLIPLASSMDQIGVLCKNMADGFSLLSLIAGHDDKDGAMFPEKRYSYETTEKAVTLCVPSNILQRTDQRTQDGIRAFAEKIAGRSDTAPFFTVVDEPLDYFDVYGQVMTILSCAEISNNITRYDGIKFGYRSPHAANLESLYVKTRTEGFGLETKLAAILGAWVLSHEQYVPYYEKAMKIRRLIKQSLRFDKYDVIALPFGGHGVTALPSCNDVAALPALTALPTLAGLPSVSFSHNGCGIQLVANVKNENALFTAWEVSQS